jgi:uncharacterized membrane protein HdeD (DUF308 family)
MSVDAMMGHLRSSWGWVVLRGIVAIVFGALAFSQPGITLAALVLVWGAYALADGLFALMAGLRIRDGGRPMWALIVIGLLGIAAGILTFVWPGMTALVLLAFIAGWALITGVFQIAAAIRFRKVIPNEWILGFAGVLSVVFGILMLARPGAGALAVVWLIGWFATLYGVLLVMLGFRMRGILTHVIPKPA